MTYEQELKDMLQSLEWRKEKIRDLKFFRVKLQKLDMTCVSSFDASSNTLGERWLTFYLDEKSDREAQRAFVHSVMKVFKLQKVEKTPSWNGKSLSCQGSTTDGNIHVRITGYVPPTCHLEQVEEAAAEWELQNAQAEIEKLSALITSGKKLVSKVVCQ